MDVLKDADAGNALFIGAVDYQGAARCELGYVRKGCSSGPYMEPMAAKVDLYDDHSAGSRL
jgi:hypothetical protein